MKMQKTEVIKMADIWLAGAAAFASLAALLCLVIDAFQDREIMETLEFLAKENDELKNRIDKTYEQTARDIELLKYSVSEIDRKIKK